MDKEAYLKAKEAADNEIKNAIVSVFRNREVPVEDGFRILGELREEIVEKNKE